MKKIKEVSRSNHHEHNVFMQGEGARPGRKGNKGTPGQPVSLSSILNENVVALL